MARPSVPSRPGSTSPLSVSCVLCGPRRAADARVCTSSASHYLLRNLQRAPEVSEAHFCRKIVSPWTERGGPIYEINKVCRFPGRGPTPGFCLWLTLGLWGIGSFCVCTLVVILLQWESPGAFYLLIQLFGSLLGCRSDAVKPM